MNIDNYDKVKNYSTVILAGGNSTRMGYPKPWVKIRNITFLLRIVNLYRSYGVEDVIVVLNEKFATSEWKNEVAEIEKEAKIIKNSSPEKGRLFSLQLGLKFLKSDFVFIHNVDNPLVENELLEELVKQDQLNDVIIPTFKNKGGHPVIVNKTVQQEITENYQNYKTLKEVFLNYSKEYIEVTSKSILKNINTPQELEKAKYELA